MKFLITAGPTREPIDPVRFLSNRSSGKMGYAIAEAALADGHEVVLISGPVCISAPTGVEIVSVTTSDEMFDAVHSRLADIDVAVLCAAVADFKPSECAPRKIKKHEGIPNITLVPTRDILGSLGAMSGKKFLLVGFAAETNNVEENARKKLREKHCDVVIANDVSVPGQGFESDENELTIFIPDQNGRVFPRAEKRELAKSVIAILTELKKKR
ncbi:MAG: phosphopantothenoylcysteine decarboxylase [Verrucomicrobiota bacterium]